MRVIKMNDDVFLSGTVQTKMRMKTLQVVCFCEQEIRREVAGGETRTVRIVY